MDRRSYLASVGTAATAVVAGCTTETDDEQTQTEAPATDRPTEPAAAPDPVDEPTADIEPEPATEAVPDDPVDEGAFSDEQYISVFESVLADHFSNATLRSVERHNSKVVLEYETTALDEETLGSEIAQVAGVFAATVSHGWDVETLFAYIFLPGQNRYSGSYSILGRNAKAYMDGSLSAEAYLRGILGTLEAHK